MRVSLGYKDKAVKRSWEEDPFIMTEEVMKNISLEVVRERLLDHVHQEIPWVGRTGRSCEMALFGLNSILSLPN
ncbi:unnamed protein product [Prunus armeniaca]|uniref:Uncharacterized protein n=1 Tax=Prunus armeniaca TaxID=36596 RepID=A0A6J5X834_PRUAR|nr:unnamed protein product [Prunus armeniaca]